MPALPQGEGVLRPHRPVLQQVGKREVLVYEFVHRRVGLVRLVPDLQEVLCYSRTRQMPTQGDRVCAPAPWSRPASRSPTKHQLHQRPQR